MNSTLISVVMSVYNSEKYLAEAIDSILNQTYTNFEFIIINDGSTDNSLAIIQAYMLEDSRIVLISRENRGLPYSLNEGVSIAKGEYIARMDADDISLPSRLEEQIDFMQKNNIDVCGSSIQVFGENIRNKIKIYPTSNNEIKFVLILMSPFAHPTVIMKHTIFDKVKYNNFKTAQDYDLWTQVALQGYKMANLDKVLLKYRSHSEQITVTKIQILQKLSYEISNKYIAKSEFRYYPDLKNLFKNRSEMTRSSTYQLFNTLIIMAKSLNISEPILINLMRLMFRTLSPMKISIAFSYMRVSRGLKKDLKGDIILCLWAIFRLKRGGKALQLLKRYI